MICHKPYQNCWDTNAKARQNKAFSLPPPLHSPPAPPSCGVDVMHPSLFQHIQHCLGGRGKAEKGFYFNIPKLLWSRSRIRVNLVKCVFAPNFVKFPKMFWTGLKSYTVSQNDTMAKILIHPSRTKLFYGVTQTPAFHPRTVHAS